MSGGHDEGTTTVNQNGPDAGRNGHVRGSFDRERQGRSAYLVGVLARALTTQVEELARVAPSTPDGWWFAEPDRTGHDDSADAGTAASADEREERR